jgi:outer membrane lipase/esterase
VNRFEVCRRAWRACGVAIGLALLASCGGSGQQVEPFVPTRVLVFGDEQSLVEADGRKYSINILDENLALSCAAGPVWTQSLAANFGIVFPGCPGTVAQPQGRMYATVNAKVADVAVQISSHLGGDNFSRTDLVTVFAGLHDILELYAQFPGRSRNDLLQDAGAAGTALAQQINRIARADGRVIFVTLQDMGRTPFALAQRIANPGDIDRVALLSDMTKSFNDKLKDVVINDGRLIGRVDEDQLSQVITSNPGTSGFANTTDAACLSTVALANCTNVTLVPNATVTSFYWADPTHLSTGAQASLGQAAQVRARGNPF